VSQEAAPGVVEQLREQLLTGALPPGTRLAQGELAATFGVSRMPIRQALQTLASEGLVELVTGATAVVTPMSIPELQELYEIREALEPLATRLAVPNVGRAELLQMRRALDVMVSTKVPAEFLAANSVFHSTLCKQANRPRLLDILEHLRKLTDRYLHLHLVVLENTDHLSEEHAGILDAVERGDSPQADSLTRQHLATSHELILNYMLDHSVADGSVQPLART
jgi:DNA-binding GntR family transcriptional regulator